MRYRNLLICAAIATGLGMVSGTAAHAETIAVDNGLAVKDSGVTTPARGMTMSQVQSKFGAPVSKVPAVGQPPISRWQYPGFVVYFELDHVIHSVVADS
jgi:hypothetical protein